eukprot:scaffold44472_cov54-Attheya_sp.AAC.6
MASSSCRRKHCGGIVMKLSARDPNAVVGGLFQLGCQGGDHRMDEVHRDFIGGCHGGWVNFERSVSARTLQEAAENQRNWARMWTVNRSGGGPEPTHQIYLALLMSTTQQLMDSCGCEEPMFVGGNENLGSSWGTRRRRGASD